MEKFEEILKLKTSFKTVDEKVKYFNLLENIAIWTKSDTNPVENVVDEEDIGKEDEEMNHIRVTNGDDSALHDGKINF